MKNIEQTVVIPAWHILRNQAPKEIMEEIQEIISSSYESEESFLKAKNDFFNKLPKETQKELAGYGILLPTDNLEIRIKLGSFLFDMFCCSEKSPTAPLAKLVYQKRLMELADFLQKDEISIPEYAIGPIKQTMLNEKDWNAAAIVASVVVHSKDNEGDTVYKDISLTSIGAGLFNDIINAAANLMMDMEKSE